MSLGPVIPTLRVASMQRSLAFYTEEVGFTVKWSWSDDGGFEAGAAPDFLCLELGEALLFLSAQGGGREAELFFELASVEDLEELARRVSDKTPLAEPVADKPWGSREFWVQDPDGHRLRFSCPSDRRRS